MSKTISKPVQRKKKDSKEKLRVAIIGGGPAAMFVYKNILAFDADAYEVAIFESKKRPGIGFPYSQLGANPEHITNVSANEIPELVTPMREWIHTVPEQVLKQYDIDPERFNEYKVLPRLLFGDYLQNQFELLLQKAEHDGLSTTVNFGCFVTDIIQKKNNEVWIETSEKIYKKFNRAIICTGHHWPVRHEGKVKGYFDSPYPPSKLMKKLNHSVALKGASLTAIDAIRTLSRTNGTYTRGKNNKLSFTIAAGSEKFKLSLHSIDGLLPAIRFHLEDPHLSKDDLLSKKKINKNIRENKGFLELDYIFDNDFKKPLAEKDPEFYAKIKDMRMEEFVAMTMEKREATDPMKLFKAEYREAERSIRKQQSIHWKEMLAILSFAMNYPAKHFSAEDMLRLTRILKPLISIVIAFVPQGSCEELIALHDAGYLQIIAVDPDSEIIPEEKKGGVTYKYTDINGVSRSDHYKVFIDCVGQPEIKFEKFPFPTLIQDGTISRATIEFRSAESGQKELEQGNQDVEQKDGTYLLNVPGITINDNFQVIDNQGKASREIYMMAVPYIAGYNPDYSGLDFCQEASALVCASLRKHRAEKE